MTDEFESIKDFDEWYEMSSIDPNTDARISGGLSKCATRFPRMFERFKTEMDARVGNYDRYERQAAAEYKSAKRDLPDVSSGESAGFLRRIARNTVQHTPNVFITNQFDDNSIPGVLARYILKSKVIGDDEYSNDMQQNLITTARRGFTLGFDCVIPVLLQNTKKQWYIQYDTIHYRDVFPEPGAKDVRRANDVFIRRWLTKGEVVSMIKTQPKGWDVHALRRLLQTTPASREVVDHENKKHSVNTDAYEVITWYNSYGDPFLTWARETKLLLRIEKNKHPLKEHPVFFYVPEKDDLQPLGKSLLSLTYGRQEFQDLFMNGAMKLWWRNVNPPIIGYGTVNALPNLSPNAYTQISNPNAKVEAFEVNPQALMMFGNISQQNAANMSQMMGAADQQMAAQSTGGMMSQTPQGVEAQQQMVDITTNNYQKAMEVFFSKYCSYALTIYFQEMSGTALTPTADIRQQMIDEGLDASAFDEKGQMKLDWDQLKTLWYVQCVPGSLIELEDEKQIRILNEMFIPLSQAMPALAQTGDQNALKMASNAMMFIIRKQLEMSDSKHSTELQLLLGGQTKESEALTARQDQLESILGGRDAEINQEADLTASALVAFQQQLALQQEVIMQIAARMGVTPDGAAAGGPEQPALTASGPVSAPGAPGDGNAAAGPETVT